MSKETTEKSSCVEDKRGTSGSAQAFVDAGFELLNEIADGNVCSERTCLRCRIADLLFEVQGKYLKEPNTKITIA
jgi:hypothetical protein